MAKVFPRNVTPEQFRPPLNSGEAKIFDYLKNWEDDWTIYVQPNLGTSKPDFIALNDKVGVFVLEHNKYTANCFDCDFEVETNTGCSLILFDAEDQGRITPLDCPHEHEAKVFSWIIAIRNGWVTVSYLKTNHTI